MKKESFDYLKENLTIWESYKLGDKKHLSEKQAETFLEIAKDIKPGVHFQIRECLDCIESLVNFVFKYYEAQVKREVKKVKLIK